MNAPSCRHSSKLLRVSFFWRNNSGERRAISSVIIAGRQRHARWATSGAGFAVVHNHPFQTGCSTRAQQHSRDNYRMVFEVAMLQVASEVGGRARIVRNDSLSFLQPSQEGPPAAVASVARGSLTIIRVP
jgi:hypothetical protein